MLGDTRDQLNGLRSLNVLGAQDSATTEDLVESVLGSGMIEMGSSEFGDHWLVSTTSGEPNNE